MDLPFEIEISEEDVQKYFGDGGCFLEAPDAELDHFTLDLTKKAHRDTLQKFYNFLCFDLPLATALERRIKELDDLGIDTEEISF